MLVKLCLLGVLGLALLAATADPPAAAAAAGENPVVAVETSMGTFKVEVFEDKAPISAMNFLGYVDDKFYDGVIFHRVIAGFMAQTGGLEPGLKEKTNKKPAIKNEASNGLTNARGTLSMARLPDPDSATSQFFINVVDNKGALDPVPSAGRAGAGYAVFGKVIEGMDVVDKIVKVKVRNVGRAEAVPVEDVTIKSVRRVERKK